MTDTDEMAKKRTWEWTIDGNWDGVRFQFDSAPNAFYRFMQRVCLGIHWRKIP
jgi:hypothetical protein